jgi:hypothetical protein
MALRITRPDEPILTENLVVTIFGQPGIGKTSVAFSASRPLLLDFDGGSQRAVGRKDVVRIRSWSDVAGIEAEDVEDFDTIVIDTVGRALEFLAAHIATNDPKLARKSGELSMQGYGALKTAYGQWLSRVRSFGKNVILIAHEKEEKNGDDTIVRIDAMGATRTEVIRLSDLVGFMSADGKSGTLDFNPTDKHTGKNCVGFDVLRIPDLRQKPAWFAEIIGKALSKMNEQSAEAKAKEDAFKDALDVISSLTTADECNDTIAMVGDDPALKTALHRHATKALNLVFNKDVGGYEVRQEVPNAAE